MLAIVFVSTHPQIIDTEVVSKPLCICRRVIDVKRNDADYHSQTTLFKEALALYEYCIPSLGKRLSLMCFCIVQFF